MSERIKELYSQLHTTFGEQKYTVLKDEKDMKEGEKKTKDVNFGGLSHFVSMRGKYYDRQDVRLFIVGRAVNGWGSLNCETSEVFGEEASQLFEQTGFNWIAPESKNSDLYNIVPKEKDRYHLNGSPFWRTARNVWDGLTGNTFFNDGDNKEKWVEYIAWSNICKIAPPVTGNPDTKMHREQIAICREILKEEIKVYKPTHILFVTGYEWWIHENAGPRTKKVAGISELLTSLKPEGHTNKNYVENITFTKEGHIPTIVVCRPERRSEEAWVSEVLSSYNEITK